MQGIIKRIVADRGFGFIKLENGEEIFFHRSSVRPETAFDDLVTTQGEHPAQVRVELTYTTTAKGLRAVSVYIQPPPM